MKKRTENVAQAKSGFMTSYYQKLGGGQVICAKVTLVPGTKPHENYWINSDRTNDSNFCKRIDGIYC